MNITQKPSPNKNSRKGKTVDCLILHDTGGSTLAGAVATCLDPSPKDRGPVSYHYIVDLDGSIVQLVEPSLRAWHAGPAALPGEAPSDVNSRSIGVAMVNDGAKPYPSAQVLAAAELCADLASRQPTITQIWSHARVALPAGRKDDPHRLFPWDRFHELFEEALAAAGKTSNVSAVQGEASDASGPEQYIPSGHHIVEDLDGERFVMNPPLPLLRRGMTGPDVAHLQIILRDLGLMSRDVPTPAQRFGDATEAAVKNFQTTHGLVVDGIVGPKTWKALGEALAAKMGLNR